MTISVDYPASLSHLYLTSILPIPFLYCGCSFVFLYNQPDTRVSASMSHAGGQGRLRLNAFPACNLCGVSIYSFPNGFSEIIHRSAAKGMDFFSQHNRRIDGRPTDLDRIQFDEVWT